MSRIRGLLRRYKVITLVPAVAVVLAALPGRGMAQDLGRAVAESYPTNLSMLTDAATASVNELLIGFAAPSGSTLLVEAAGDHEANWFVENLLLGRLSDSGYSAYLKQGQFLGPEIPEELADSLRVLDGGDAAPDTVEATAAAGPEPEFVLRYRVAEFGISYPDSYKKSPLGSRKVQRHAEVNLFAHLIQGKREDVVWVGRGEAQRLDIVPSSKLPLLEGRSFPFQRPTLETRGLGSFVEPALVTGIVAGLIYLFYTNQN